MDSQIPSKSCLRLNGFSESVSIFYLSDTAPSHVLFEPYNVPRSEFGVILSLASDMETEAERSNFPELAPQMSDRHRL